MQTSAFQFYSKGIASEDLKLDGSSTGYLQVFPEEHHSSADIEITSEESKVEKSNIKTTSGKNMGSKLENGYSLKAKWLNMGSPNRVTPPFVKKGEAVMIYKFGESDLYYWSTMFTEMDIRKKEAVLNVYANTDEHGKTTNKDNSYWTLMDTVKKKAQVHTAKNDGEIAGYDVILDGAKGLASIVDTEGNKFILNSKTGTLDIKLKRLNLNVDEVNITGGNIIFRIVSHFLKKVRMNGNALTMTCPKGVTTKVR